MDARATDAERQEVELDDEQWGAAKTLYISDSDKRKSFALHHKVFHTNGYDHGTFRSKPVKVRLCEMRNAKLWSVVGC